MATRQIQPKIGWVAPPLEGTTAGGDPYRLADLRPRPVLVEFHRGTW